MTAGPITTKQVAERLGIDPSRVIRLAAKYGIGAKLGRDWLFTAADVDALRDRSTGKPGRPRKLV